MILKAEKLLRIVGPLHIAGGLLLFASAFSPAVLAFMQIEIANGDETLWSPFFATVLGPSIASWGVLFTALVKQFQQSPSPSLWRALALSVVVWAPLDTILCLKYEVYSGVVINSIVFILLGGLLYLARKSIP